MDDAEDNGITTHSDNGANDDAVDNAERGTKPRAAGKADKYGARGVRAATTPQDSDDDSDNSANMVVKPNNRDSVTVTRRRCDRNGGNGRSDSNVVALA